MTNYTEILEEYKKKFPNMLANIRRFEVQNIANYNSMVLALGTDPKQATKRELKQEPIYKADLTDNKYTQLVKKMQYLYNQKAKFCNSLHTFKAYENAERSLVVTQILRLKEEYNSLAVLKKHYERFGELPEEPAEQERKLSENVAELRVLAKNIHSNLAKNRKKLSAADTDLKKKKYQENIAKLNAELELINKKIRLNNG